jgi:hypothetical protein
VERSILDYFFHPPTLVTVALVSIVLVWQFYDVGMSGGNGFLRVTTNQGKVNIYWIHGCCDIDW